MSEKNKLNKFEQLLVDWQKIEQPEHIDEDEPTIKVHQTVSYLSWMYERTRIFLDNDNNDGHDVYKTINRILKRLLLIEKRKPENVPLLLLIELIRAGFLKNNKVPQKYTKSIWHILDKYIILMDKISVKINQSIINNNATKGYGRIKKREINKWLIAIASREVERFLFPQDKEEIITKSMYEYLVEQFNIDVHEMSEQDKKTQIYIAVHRAFMKSNDDILSYYLFKLHYSKWTDCDEEYLEIISKNIFKTKDIVDKQLTHSIRHKLKKLCLKQVVYFILLLDILENIGSNGLIKLTKNQEELDSKIADTTTKIYKQARRKIRLGMFMSVFYVLITKYIVLKIPLSQGVEITDPEYLVILLLGPSIMLLVGLSIINPGHRNTEKIIRVLKRMIFQDKIRNIPHIIKQIKNRSALMSMLFALLYIILFIIVIGLIYLLFNYYGFSNMVTTITLFFFSMIYYFGFRLREIMRQYVTLDRKENTIGFVFDFMSLPVLKLGQILSSSLKKINLSIPLMDYVLESPYKAFINIFENWTFFVREKKDDID